MGWREGIGSIKNFPKSLSTQSQPVRKAAKTGSCNSVTPPVHFSPADFCSLLLGFVKKFQATLVIWCLCASLSTLGVLCCTFGFKVSSSFYNTDPGISSGSFDFCRKNEMENIPHVSLSVFYM